MTGGVAVVLGETGDNFGAGMTGGMAFVYDPATALERRINPGSIVVQRLASQHWESVLYDLIEEHVRETGSRWAAGIIADWERARTRFWQVVPKEMLSRLAFALDDTISASVAAE